jgi:hypothetical protein
MNGWQIMLSGIFIVGIFKLVAALCRGLLHFRNVLSKNVKPSVQNESKEVIKSSSRLIGIVSFNIFFGIASVIVVTPILFGVGALLFWILPSYLNLIVLGVVFILGWIYIGYVQDFLNRIFL